MLNFLSRLFHKESPKSFEQIELEISLKKWDDFHWIHSTFICEVITHCNLNDLAISLVHCDKMKAHIANNVLHPDYVKFRNIPNGHSPIIG